MGVAVSGPRPRSTAWLSSPCTVTDYSKVCRNAESTVLDVAKLWIDRAYGR